MGATYWLRPPFSIRQLKWAGILAPCHNSYRSGIPNPLLKEPLKLSHVKPLVVGHWGTTPGQNFIYVHLNRVIKKYDLDMFYIAGPGHGGPAIVGNVYLEGTWTDIYPNVTMDEAGMKKLFKQFSFPGGISSHVAPTTPGSIHEGGELGYSLSHAFGAAFDNPDLIADERSPPQRKPAVRRRLTRQDGWKVWSGTCRLPACCSTRESMSTHAGCGIPASGMKGEDAASGKTFTANPDCRRREGT